MNLFLRRTALGVTAAALTAALTACGTTSTAGSTTTPAAVSTTAMSTPVILSTAATVGSRAAATHNDADVMFAQQMIVHHQGAIAMADLAPTRASSQQVKVLADTIKTAQAPEIEQMTGWLRDWAPETDLNGMPMTSRSQMSSDMMSSTDGMGGVDHGGTPDLGGTSTSAGGTAMSMPGVMTDTQMTDLTATGGTEFDKLFLQMMIAHHQGAIEMADTELAQGSNPDAMALAQTITTSQTQEIATMQQLLSAL